ncbi:MAG: glycoside hydrolase family 92 protein, partial [Flavobacteriaceae bacterium]|nr:glycoside hydrolase family 92 protein [Flavobacteriaceae bacterium]
MKGIRAYNTEEAFAAIKHSAMQDRLGLRNYKKTGFIPVVEESESVSNTLEYAYDDWTIAIMAQEMGKMEDYHTFIKRAQSYKNLYNPKTGFMQGRFRNTWFGPFDPYEVNFNYTEANAWQYSLYVPQDISGLIQLMGGKDKFEKHLDELFTAEEKTSGRDQADITGLIGQYAHGNEPSHHMAYLYNFVQQPAKTQRLVRQILNELYSNTPEGISGNEDCGQMSAWYVFSSLGFYPVTPGSNQYIIGSPLFEKASINLENGNTFSIISNNNSENHPYIASATLNGQSLNRSYLFHDEIMDGGQLVLEMSNTPTSWASDASEVPHTEIEDDLIVLTPYLAQGKTAFKDVTEVKIESPQKEVTIYYRLDAGPFQKYTQPIKINSTCVLETYAEMNSEKSPTMATQFNKIDKDLSVELRSQYANEYSAGGQNALIDGIQGTKDFRTGAWQGYWGKDVIAEIDRGDSKLLKSISINFLQDQRSWIFYPKKVQIFVAGANKKFRLSKERSINAALKDDQTAIKTLHFNINKRNIQYIKVVAVNFGKLPTWHPGAPEGDAWTFIDEINIE